jgi:hypothetical protein
MHQHSTANAALSYRHWYQSPVEQPYNFVSAGVKDPVDWHVLRAGLADNVLFNIHWAANPVGIPGTSKMSV